jgi:hypothetical protein
MRRRHHATLILFLCAPLALTLSCHLLVSDPVIYVAGSYSTLPAIACYWRDGYKIDRPGSGNSVQSIHVMDGEVCLAGMNDLDQPCYWRGSAGTVLPNAAGVIANGFVNAVTGWRGDLYLAGGSSGACYWRNGGQPAASPRRLTARLPASSPPPLCTDPPPPSSFLTIP